MARYFKILAKDKRCRIILILLAITVVHNEILSFWRDWISWPAVTCQEDCIRILIVADPQILGSASEPLSFFGYMDTDVYIQKSFHHASDLVKPDAILFLGDLMNEGSSSTDEDYKSYKKRFDRIFDTSHLLHRPEMIYIPGDNDIGGEGNDRVTQAKVDRFNRNFPSEVQTTIKNVYFVPVNRIVSDFKLPEVTPRTNYFRAVLSHIPLTFMPGIFSKQVTDRIKPHLVFSAHDHRTALGVTQLDQDRFDISASFEKSHLFRKRLNYDETIEVIFPTCSYRMGVRNAGYGFATINRDGELEVGILWIHSRFSLLWLYLLVIFVCLVIRLVPARFIKAC